MCDGGVTYNDYDMMTVKICCNCVVEMDYGGVVA